MARMPASKQTEDGSFPAASGFGWVFFGGGLVVFMIIAIFILRTAWTSEDFLSELPSQEIVKLAIESEQSDKKMTITDPAKIQRVLHAIAGYQTSMSPSRECGPATALYLTSTQGRQYLVVVLFDKRNDEAVIYPNNMDMPKGFKGQRTSKELTGALADAGYQLPIQAKPNENTCR